ncbi:unnamed protein product [Pylaiella littoralis]
MKWVKCTIATTIICTTVGEKTKKQQPDHVHVFFAVLMSRIFFPITHTNTRVTHSISSCWLDCCKDFALPVSLQCDAVRCTYRGLTSCLWPFRPFLAPCSSVALDALDKPPHQPQQQQQQQQRQQGAPAAAPPLAPEQKRRPHQQGERQQQQQQQQQQPFESDVSPLSASASSSTQPAAAAGQAHPLNGADAHSAGDDGGVEPSESESGTHVQPGNVAVAAAVQAAPAAPAAPVAPAGTAATVSVPATAAPAARAAEPAAEPITAMATTAAVSGTGKTEHYAGGGGGGMGREGGTPDAETLKARNAAVATAVEARSRTNRVSEGLDGGAGADGGAAGANFEYLDHTADVQLHSWGDSIERAMEGALAAMFNTITDIAKIDPDPSLTRLMEIEGHDAKSLLFALLDEFLFLFHSEGLAVKRATVHGSIVRGGGDSGDGGHTSAGWKLRATAEGETFDLTKHPQGTEVKAITYSNMQIHEAPDGRTDIYVIVDI